MTKNASLSVFPRDASITFGRWDQAAGRAISRIVGVVLPTGQVGAVHMDRFAHFHRGAPSPESVQRFCRAVARHEWWVMQHEGRREAGLVLASELSKLDPGPCVVAGISSGGMVVAAAVAERLGVPLIALQTRDLFASGSPELAFGAMDAEGHAILDYRAVVTLGLGEADIESIKAAVHREMDARAALHHPSRPRDFLAGRTVVLVDEALAAGLRMQAAIGQAKSHGAMATIVAAPCGSDRAVYEVRSLLGRADDRLICLQVDAGSRAARDYYQSFPPVSETEVAQLLEDAASRCAGGPASPGLRRGILS